VDAAHLVKQARTARGISQRRLAVRAGTSQAFVCRIELGRVSPTVETLRRLLLVLGEDLVLDTRRIGGEDRPPTEPPPASSMEERLARGLAFSSFAAELRGQARRR